MKRKKGNPSSDHWPSFTDLLGAFVLVVTLGLLFFMISFRQAEGVVNKQEKELDKRRQQLVRIRQEIIDQREKLRQERVAKRKLLSDLRHARLNLLKAKGAKKHLEKLLKRLEKERMEIEKARARAEAALAKARLALSRAEAAREKCQRRIERYVGVKKRIIASIFAGLRKRLEKKGQDVRLDKKGGSILLSSNVLFPKGGHNLGRRGKSNLEKVWLAVEEVVLSPINKPYIAGVVIEGYTSSEGRVKYNWRLSMLRALSATRHVLSFRKEKWAKLRGRISAAGYGPTRVIFNKEGKEDKKASRRIEIRIIFRDREQLNKLARELKKDSSGK